MEFTKEQEDDLAREVMQNPAYDGKTVVIAWVRSYLPKLGRALGGTNIPDAWDKNEFARYWIFTYKAKAAPEFSNLPQHLLPGDSAQ